MKLLLLAAFVLGSAARCAWAGFDDAQTAIHYQDYARAVPLLRAEVARGNAEAMRTLAELYTNGYGVPEDAKSAFKLYRRAEAAGDALAALDVVDAYEWGKGVAKSTETAAALKPKALERLKACAQRGETGCMELYARQVNTSEALALYEKVIAKRVSEARGGEPYSQYMVGEIYSNVPAPLADGAAARDWLKRSADQGYPPAMELLGRWMAAGYGGPEDIEGGMDLWQKAAQGGLACAWKYMSQVNPHKGQKREPAEKAELLRKAAEGGCLSAAVDLGTFSRQELQDYDQAHKWYFRAAKAGDRYSQDMLSSDYRFGAHGLPQDKAEAYKWLLLANYGDEAGLAADDLWHLSDLTPEDRAEGRKRAQAFQATAYSPALKPFSRKAAAKTVAAAPAPSPVSASEAPATVSAQEPLRLPERPDDYALVVGVEHYRNLPAADYAESDAAAVAERLVDLGFPRRNVITLIGEDATRSKLQAYLEEWLPKNVGKDSRVFFYFSGHGSPDAKTGEAFLVPADGAPEFLKSTAYPLKSLYAELGALPAKQIVVALDSCFSGAGGRSVLAKGVRPLVNKVDVAAHPGPGGRLIILAAAAGDQMTGDLEDQEHGAFTYYLLEGLSGAAKNRAGAITAQSLEAYVKPKVADAARRQNRDQTPVLYGDPAAVLFKLK